MQKLKIKDNVVVVAGRDKGKTGEVKKILGNKVYVAGVNILKKTQRGTQENPTGGIVEIEGPINRSNIMHYSEKAQSRSRIQIVEQDGKTVRILKKCKTVLA